MIDFTPGDVVTFRARLNRDGTTSCFLATCLHVEGGAIKIRLGPDYLEWVASANPEGLSPKERCADRVVTPERCSLYRRQTAVEAAQARELRRAWLAGTKRVLDIFMHHAAAPRPDWLEREADELFPGGAR